MVLRQFYSNHTRLVWLLVVSAIARVALIATGGQLFWPDETRYLRSIHALQLAAAGQVREAADYVFANQEHLGFTFFNFLSGALQFIIKSALGLSGTQTMRVPALVLSLASLACIALTYAIAYQATHNVRAADLAALFMTTATTMLYWSRHLVPYDLAMALTLVALWFAINPLPSTRNSIGCGIFIGLAFVVYSGFWVSYFVVVLIHLAAGPWSAQQMFRRGLLCGAAAAAWIALLSLVTWAFGYTPYIISLTQLAGSVNWGDYAEGWTIIWEYLWSAEHIWLIVWLAGAAVSIRIIIERKPSAPVAILWLGAIGVMVILFGVTSVIMQKFIVHARLARQLVPFLCLAAATGWAVLPNPTRVVAGLAALILTSQTVYNMLPAFSWQRPQDVEEVALQKYGAINYASTVKTIEPEAWHAQKPARYVLLNALFPAPVQGTQPAPAGNVIFSVMHPLQFEPFQYEFYNATERGYLRSVDFSLKLIDTQAVTP